MHVGVNQVHVLLSRKHPAGQDVTQKFSVQKGSSCTFVWK